ncbi:hypothetical protein HYH02_006039 [Chlamydomonas schloesseri]|uniref:Flagellar associated protein n=1 Tax=Chlamydomonas schloesseri TaxID=2026947 RepID=A0A835WJS4_9CHLO|nr:hypothetical protein HYH02_006039 [Chlamydomonas schloesseri]|eukprot:KAG2448682.1 hypothetical protein HYH02_006039 [Chlamydomonas schloesseri]
MSPGSPLSTTVTAPLSGARALTPLQRAALEGDFETVVCELVLKGADVNEKCSLPNQNNDLVEGVTPLYLAAQSGNSEMCRLLLRRGADARLCSLVIRTGERFTPADVALTRGYVRLWWRLRRSAKSPNKSKVMAEAMRRQASVPEP